MSTIQEPAAVDVDKLMAFVFRAVDEVGATLNAALVVMGDRLGLYKAMAGAGPLTPAELAERTGTAERYVREWLNAQAAGGFVDYDPDTGRYTLPAEQAIALTDESSPAFLPGFFQIALGSVLDSPRITEAARTGDGRRLARARPRRLRRLRAVLPPRLQRQPRLRLAAGARRRGRQARARRDGRRRRLRPRRLDDPDGAGVPATRRSSAPTTTRARSRPRAQRAAEAGVADRVRFEVAAAASYSGAAATTWSTMFDCLHDMGDPVGAARHVRQSLARRRHLDDRRAGGRRPRRGQPQPGRAGLLRLLDAAVHARRRCRRRSGWRSARRPARPGSATSSPAPGFTRFRRVERDAVQPGVRGTYLISGGAAAHRDRPVSCPPSPAAGRPGKEGAGGVSPARWARRRQAVASRWPDPDPGRKR